MVFADRALISQVAASEFSWSSELVRLGSFEFFSRIRIRHPVASQLDTAVRSGTTTTAPRVAPFTTASRPAPASSIG